MQTWNTLAYLVFPYIALTIFVVGHIYRYRKDPFRWNAKSSELLEKESLRYGSTIFHWGILLTLFGHAGGLLIPQSIFDFFGIDAGAHTLIAFYSGIFIGFAAFIGSALLLYRRYRLPRIRVTTSTSDFIALALLFFTTGIGLFNVFRHYNVLYTIAPWIRSIVFLHPEPELMTEVPSGFKIHILSAFLLFAYSPFSRLIHIWSAPFGYMLRNYIVFRKYGGVSSENYGKD
jgi:nitrate reductase gamma subunit